MGKQVKNWVLKDWTVNPKLNLIQNHQTEFKVKPRLMKLLEFFLLNHNKVVTRDAILDYVWVDRIVTENLLTKSISELRKLLEEHFQDEVQIETIRNVGYRFQSTFEVVSTSREVARADSTLKKVKKPIGLVIFLPVVFLLAGLLAFFYYDSKTTYSFDLEIISSLKGQELTPIISPNGKNIAFAWRENTSQPFYIYIKSLEENNPRKLSNHKDNEFNPAWSPDGQFIAFMRHSGTGDLILVKKAVVGDDEMELANLNGFAIVPGMIWTKDGSLLVFSAKREQDSTCRMYAFDLQKEQIKVLTEPSAGLYGDLHPAFSHRNDQIVFVRAHQGKSILSDVAPTTSSIINLDLNTLDTFLLANIEHEIKALVYHPKLRQHLCWVSPNLGYNELYAINSKGQKRKLRSFSRGMTGKGSIGGGDTFYFEYWQSSVNVVEYSLASAISLMDKPVEYLNSTQWDWGLRFGGKAEKMAFISLRNGYQEIWTAPSNEPEAAKQVTRLESPMIQSLSLSPDGKKILFLTTENNQPSIYFVNTNGQNLQKLSEDGPAYSSPEWSADGHFFYYSSNKSGEWNLWKRNLHGSKDQMITQEGGHTVFADPIQDESLYFIKNNPDTIWHLNLKQGVPKPLCVTSGLEPFNWSPQPEGIYYLAWQKGRCHLYFFEFANKTTHRLKSFEYIIPGIPALAIPPDRSSVFIAQSDELNVDILSLQIE